MPNPLALLILVITAAIGFGIVNGVNDAANAIATVIGTRSLSPRAAIIMAAISNFAGAVTGTAVAITIGKGIVDSEALTMSIVLAGSGAITIWAVVVSAVSISFGTLIGGWRVIKTLGLKVTTLRPVHGFAAEASAATVIEVASHFGIPVSTTHCISTAIMGVGATRRLSAVRWGIARNIVLTWILTFPACAILGWIIAFVLKLIF